MPTQSSTEPLNPDEEQLWRAFVRLIIELPRAIDEDLSQRAGLGLTRYVVLMRLSEAPDHALRMSQLAEAASMSPSRITRIVQSMTGQGLLARADVPDDGRASLATLTPAGLRRLEEVWPAHLAGVRALVMDHIPPEDLADFSRVTRRLVRAIEGVGTSGALGKDPAAAAPSIRR